MRKPLVSSTSTPVRTRVFYHELLIKIHVCHFRLTRYVWRLLTPKWPIIWLFRSSFLSSLRVVANLDLYCLTTFAYISLSYWLNSPNTVLDDMTGCTFDVCLCVFCRLWVNGSAISRPLRLFAMYACAKFVSTPSLVSLWMNGIIKGLSEADCDTCSQKV